MADHVSPPALLSAVFLVDKPLLMTGPGKIMDCPDVHVPPQ